MLSKKVIIQSIIGLVCFGILIGLLWYIGIFKYFTLEQLKLHRSTLKQYVYDYYYVSVIWYIALYFLVAALALPFASLFTLAGGMLFGFIEACVYTNIGATLGAVAIFVLVRYYFGDYVQERYHKQLQKFNAELEENGISYLLVVRVISVIPFFVINICSGLTKIPLWQYALTTFIGITPGNIVYTYAGQQLMYIDTLGDILSFPVIAAFAGLAILAILPVIIKKMVVWIKQ